MTTLRLHNAPFQRNRTPKNANIALENGVSQQVPPRCVASLRSHSRPQRAERA
jgi:hypothetical protein